MISGKELRDNITVHLYNVAGGMFLVEDLEVVNFGQSTLLASMIDGFEEEEERSKIRNGGGEDRPGKGEIRMEGEASQGHMQQYVRQVYEWGIGENEPVTLRVYAVPAFLSLIPPFMAIFAAFISRQILLSLLFAALFACFVLYEYNPWKAYAHMLDSHFVPALADYDHAIILLFILVMSVMISTIIRLGGLHAITAMVTQR